MFGEKRAGAVKCCVISSSPARRTKAEGRPAESGGGRGWAFTASNPVSRLLDSWRQELTPHEKFQGEGPSHTLFTPREFTVEIIE